MGFNYQPQTDLASILQTLQAYAPSQQQTPQAIYQSQALRPNNEPRAPPAPAADLEEGEYDPSAYDPSLPLITTPHPQAPAAQSQQSYSDAKTPLELKKTIPPYPRQPPEPTPASKPPSSTPGPKKAHTPPAYHAATITTWAPALRHVTGQATSNLEFVHRVRHLITTQHKHERQWWDGREELKKRLAGREEGRKKLDSVLGSLGGHINSKNDELSEEQELKLYDRKVHKACKEMAAATVKELKKLEVPFFCILDSSVSEKGDEKVQGKRKAMTSEQDLVELRGRMMVLLEDLCGEE